MRTVPQLRKRYTANGTPAVSQTSGQITPATPPNTAAPAIKTGGLTRIFQGIFGIGSPAPDTSSPAAVVHSGTPYMFYEGDLFEPGTGNWVFEPFQDLPLMTIWGNGFLRVPNTFNPTQPPQVMSSPTLTPNGIGGLVAGQVAFQPLSKPTPEQGG